MLSDESSSPMSFRERLSIMAPASFRVRSRLPTEETIFIRNTATLQHPATPKQHSKMKHVDVNADECPLSCHTMKVDENPFLEVAEEEDVALSRLEEEDKVSCSNGDQQAHAGQNDQDDDVDEEEASVSDVSTLSNVSQHHQRLLMIAYQNHLNNANNNYYNPNPNEVGAPPVEYPPTPEQFLLMEAAAQAAAAAAAPVPVPHRETAEGVAEHDPNNQSPPSESPAMIPREICFVMPTSRNSKRRNSFKRNNYNDLDDSEDDVPDWLRINNPPSLSHPRPQNHHRQCDNLALPSLSPLSPGPGPSLSSPSFAAQQQRQQRHRSEVQFSPRPRFLLPPPPLDTSSPSPSIPRPTLGKHCQSAPVPTMSALAGAMASPFPPSQQQLHQQHQRPLSIARQFRARSDVVAMSKVRHDSTRHQSPKSSLSSSSSSSSSKCLQRFLGNRERYQPPAVAATSSSNRSLVTLSVGSLVGQSSWVTAPPAITTITTMSTSNDDRTITSHYTSTAANNNNSNTKASCGGAGDEQDQQRENNGTSSKYYDLSPCRSKKSSMVNVKGDVKLLLDRVLRKWKLHHNSSNNNNSSSNNQNAVNLKRSSGCLT